MESLLQGPFGTVIFLIPMLLLFWLLIFRPQQKQMKAHREMVAGIKRGDTVVMSNGMIGKVTRVENEEAMVEIAQGVNVRVVKGMVTEVRNLLPVARGRRGSDAGRTRRQPAGRGARYPSGRGHPVDRPGP